MGEISTIKFEDLIKVFPDLTASPSSAILKQIKDIRHQLDVRLSIAL